MMVKFFCFLLVLMPSLCYSLGYQYTDRFLKRVAWHTKMKTPYVWGGTDCSGTMADAAFDAGIPVVRTTALFMARGVYGWKGVDVTRGETVPSDLMWWTNSISRPFGHVGTKTSSKTFGHASSSKGHFVEDDFHGDYSKKAILFRRLTFGDPK